MEFRAMTYSDRQMVSDLFLKEVSGGEYYVNFLDEAFARLGKGCLGVFGFEGGNFVGASLAEEGMVLTGSRTDYFEQIRQDIGDGKIWTCTAIAVAQEYRRQKAGAALFLSTVSALKAIGVSYMLGEIWIRPDGFMPSRGMLTLAKTWKSYGVVQNFYADMYKQKFVCPVCGAGQCVCSAEIVVVETGS